MSNNTLTFGRPYNSQPVRAVRESQISRDSDAHCVSRESRPLDTYYSADKHIADVLMKDNPYLTGPLSHTAKRTKLAKQVIEQQEQRKKLKRAMRRKF